MTSTLGAARRRSVAVMGASIRRRVRASSCAGACGDREALAGAFKDMMHFRTAGALLGSARKGRLEAARGSCEVPSCKSRCLGRAPFGAPAAPLSIHLVARVLRELDGEAVAAQS